jgi:hypothetical protein
LYASYCFTVGISDPNYSIRVKTLSSSGKFVPDSLDYEFWPFAFTAVEHGNKKPFIVALKCLWRNKFDQTDVR